MAASTGSTPVTAPDVYGTGPGKAGYLSCHGARVVTLQISNQGIVFQPGIGDPPLFDGQAEYSLLPVVDRRTLHCDAIRFRAQVPLAKLPAGSLQAAVQIDTYP
jgi:hypothetical protein